MGFFESLGNIVSAPFNAGAQALSAVKGAWDDYTGKTATDMSISASKANTQAQLAWERERATNAHQWEVSDLEKAGLNPILSAGGSGATSGGISPQMPDVSQYKGTGGAIAQIGEILRNQTNTSTQLQQNEEKILSEISLNEMLGIKANADAVNALSNAKKADQDAITATTESLKNKAQSELLNEQTKHLKIMESDLNEKIKQGRSKTLLLYEQIKNAPTKAEKLKYEAELKKLQKDLFVAGKVVAAIATVGTGAGALANVAKIGKVYKAGKAAIKALSNIK